MRGWVGARGFGCWCGEGGIAALNADRDDSSCGREEVFTRGRHRKCVRGGFFSLGWWLLLFGAMVE